jgi:hypothetical protein
MMTFVNSWHFRCRQGKRSGEYLLENSKGMLAGEVEVDSDEHGTTLVVVNSQHETALVLKTASGRNHHVVVLAPRRMVADAKTGLAVHGVVDLKARGYDTVYEYESSTGSEVMQVAAGGFPRRLFISKGGVQIAEIEKRPGEITVNVGGQAKDTDTLVIIGITLAVCLLLPIQANSPRCIQHSAILIG